MNGELISSLTVPPGEVDNVGRKLKFGRFWGIAGRAFYYNQGAKKDELMIFIGALGEREIKK